MARTPLLAVARAVRVVGAPRHGAAAVARRMNAAPIDATQQSGRHNESDDELLHLFFFFLSKNEILFQDW